MLFRYFSIASIKPEHATYTKGVKMGLLNLLPWWGARQPLIDQRLFISLSTSPVREVETAAFAARPSKAPAVGPGASLDAVLWHSEGASEKSHFLQRQRWSV